MEPRGSTLSPAPWMCFTRSFNRSITPVNRVVTTPPPLQLSTCTWESDRFEKGFFSRVRQNPRALAPQTKRCYYFSMRRAHSNAIAVCLLACVCVALEMVNGILSGKLARRVARARIRVVLRRVQRLTRHARVTIDALSISEKKGSQKGMDVWLQAGMHGTRIRIVKPRQATDSDSSEPMRAKG